MTDAQTEARAIARWNPTGFGLGMEADTGGSYVRYEDHTTALAAKNAELEEWRGKLAETIGKLKVETDRADRRHAADLAAKDAELAAQLRATQDAWNERDGEKRLRLRAEAQLAEANKALEFYADTSKYPAPFTGGFGGLYYDCGQIARRALTGGQEE